MNILGVIERYFELLNIIKELIKGMAYFRIHEYFLSHLE